MAQLLLEIVEGEQAGKQVELSGSVEIGRDPSLPLALDDDEVSRHHVRMYPSEHGAVVEDLNSTNGTYVNDQPVHAAREIAPGDRVRLGVTVLELRTREQVAVQPSAARPVPQVTALGRDVLQPVPEAQMPAAAPQAGNIPSFLVEQTEPAFVPRDVLDDEAQSSYSALASLVDAKVKRQTNVAFFAFLSLAGLAVLIFFGVR